MARSRESKRKTSTEEESGALEASPPTGLSVTISRCRNPRKHEKGTQTVYRESEAQTLPWTPEAVFTRRKDGARMPLELLRALGDGPIGTDDLILMERARQRHLWENTLPRASSKRIDAIRLSCVASVAANEAAFRESSLTAECERRLRISESNLRRDREEMLSELDARLRNMREEKGQENAEVLEHRKREWKRRMRRLGRLQFDGNGERGRRGLGFPGCRRDSRDQISFPGVDLPAPSPRRPLPQKACSRVAKRAENELARLATGGTGAEGAAARAPGASLRRRTGRNSEEAVAQAGRDQDNSRVPGRAVRTRLFSDAIELQPRKSKLPASRKEENSAARNGTQLAASPRRGVCKTAPTKAANSRGPSSFVILGEMLNTPVQSRPASPGRVSPFRGHGFKSPAASRAPSPDEPSRIAAAKPSPPKKAPAKPPKFKTDIGLPPKSPKRLKTRPARNPLVQKTNLVDKGKPDRTPRPGRKPLTVARDKKTGESAGAKETAAGEVPQQTDLNKVSEALNDLAADAAAEEQPEKDPVAEAEDRADEQEPGQDRAEAIAEDESATPAAEIACSHPDKCQVAPPTMASPSPIITSAINAPTALTKATESIPATATHTSTVTTSSLNAISSAVTISGNLARKAQSHSPREPESTGKSEEETLAAAEESGKGKTPDPADAPSRMPPPQRTGSANGSDSVRGDVVSTSNVIRVDSEMELLSANGLRDSPPRRQPNPAWNEERLINGSVPSATENRGRFRRFLSSVWQIIKYVLCCRCVVDRCRRAACCRCDSKCCRRERESKAPWNRLNVFGNCCSCRCCKCKKPKCLEKRRTSKQQPPPPPRTSSAKGKCCAKANCSCSDCCAKMRNCCSGCGSRANGFCRALFCLNTLCCQRCLRKCCKCCHKMKCCQSGGCCSCFNPGAKRPPKLDKRASTQSKSEKENLDPVLVEHVSLMKAAIPVLPTCLAMLCLILNMVFPGSGTLMSGIFCLCFGKPRFSVKDTAKNRVGSFCVNLVIGVAQLFTIVFCLVGWGWSVWWGVIMYRLARKRRRIRLAEKSTQEANEAARHNHVDLEKG